MCFTPQNIPICVCVFCVWGCSTRRCRRRRQNNDNITTTTTAMRRQCNYCSNKHNGPINYIDECVLRGPACSMRLCNGIVMLCCGPAFCERVCVCVCCLRERTSARASAIIALLLRTSARASERFRCVALTLRRRGACYAVCLGRTNVRAHDVFKCSTVLYRTSAMYSRIYSALAKHSRRRRRRVLLRSTVSERLCSKNPFGLRCASLTRACLRAAREDL